MKLLSTISILFLCTLGLQAQYTMRSISELRVNDADGVPELSGSTCEIRGIVHSPSFRTSGLQFVLIDEENAGVTVFSSDFEGYNAKLGDELVIQGTVDFFNGLTEIIPDSIGLMSEGNALQEPTPITELNEATESQLVTIKDVSLVDANQWTGQGSGFNVDMTDGTNIFTVRVDNNTDLYNLSAPEGTFDVIGVGGQFDNSAPYDGGYQLFPRSAMDISVEVVEEIRTYPAYTIGQVTTNNAEGEPDSLRVTCELEGVVYGTNLRAGNDLQFTLIDDNNDGIGVFSPIDFGYTVTEGDRIAIKGEISFFNGITQIFPDSLRFISAGNALFAPTEVTDLGEDTESQLIKINCLQLATIDTANWMPMNNAFNITFVEPNSGREYLVRVDEQTNIFEQAAPTGLVNITGLGWQFDNAAPYDDFYQIAPRYAADFEACETVHTEELLASSSITLYPNPAPEILHLETKASIEQVIIYDVAGRKVLVQQSSPQVNIAHLAKGIYTIQVRTTEGVWMDKFMKQ